MEEITIRVVKYKANDGKVFDTREACKQHEQTIREAESLKRALRRIKQICLVNDCDFCPFRNSYGCIFTENVDPTPDYWNIED